MSYADALLEAQAVAPTERAMLTCIEIFQPDGTPDGAIYLVANPVDFVAKKEATALRDPGATVTFMAAPLRSEVQEESDSASQPEKSLSLDNVSGIASDALRLARGSLEPWHIEERVYASDDPSGPAVLPVLQLLIEKANISGSSVAFVATYGDPANVAVPGIKFRRVHYPTLTR